MTTPERTLAELKHDARQRAKATRASLDREHAASCSQGLAEQLLTLPELQHAHLLVLGYAALPEEIDPSPAVTALLRRGLRTAYPRVESEGVLGLHLALEPDLTEGRYGIREPLVSAPRVEPDEVNVVLVPGVAFDERGFRLGYGGGYYDRLLPQLTPDAVRIGLAFDEQLVEELPCEEHDVRLDVLVTPTRVIRP